MNNTKELLEDFQYEVINQENLKYDITFKLIIVGDSGVGKSCLTQQAVHNKFQDNYIVTVGFEFFSFMVKIKDKIIKLQIWDTCGQELYHSLITNFYRNASLAIMVYSINNTDSFEHIDKWLRELKEHSSPDAKVFIVGNKTDLEEDRKVLYADGEQFKNDYNLDLFVETSAKTGFNAQKLLVEAARILLEDHQKYHIDSVRCCNNNSL